MLDPETNQHFEYKGNKKNRNGKNQIAAIIGINILVNGGQEKVDDKRAEQKQQRSVPRAATFDLRTRERQFRRKNKGKLQEHMRKQTQDEEMHQHMQQVLKKVVENAGKD
jgi:hypothetical protein